MLNEEKKIKIIKFSVIGGLFLLLIIIALCIYYNYSKEKDILPSKKYVIVGNYLILEKTKQGFNQIKSIDDELFNLKFTITNGIDFEKNVYPQFINNDWYFFDKDYNEIKMSDFRIATHNLDIKLGNFTKERIVNVVDDVYTSKYLSQKNISAMHNYVATKISFDFDQDGNNEYIYTIDNDSLSATDGKIYGFIFMVRNGKIVSIAEQEKAPFLICEIMDIDNDGTYEMIVSDNVRNLPTFDSCYKIYKLKNKSWEIEKDCK